MTKFLKRVENTVEKEKLLVTSNFSFSHSIFRRFVLQTRKSQGIFWKGLNNLSQYETANSGIPVLFGHFSYHRLHHHWTSSHHISIFVNVCGQHILFSCRLRLRSPTQGGPFINNVTAPPRKMKHRQVILLWAITGYRQFHYRTMLKKSTSTTSSTEQIWSLSHFRNQTKNPVTGEDGFIGFSSVPWPLNIPNGQWRWSKN